MKHKLWEGDYFVNPVPNGRELGYGILFDDTTGELSLSEWVRKDMKFYQQFYTDDWLADRMEFIPDGWTWLGEEETLIERLITYGKANLDRSEE